MGWKRRDALKQTGKTGGHTVTCSGHRELFEHQLEIKLHITGVSVVSKPDSGATSSTLAGLEAQCVTGCRVPSGEDLGVFVTWGWDLTLS